MGCDMEGEPDELKECVQLLARCDGVIGKCTTQSTTISPPNTFYFCCNASIPAAMFRIFS